MSDSCLYDFEDTVWDEFCQSDDHIVPHPHIERADNHSRLGDSLKKHCPEATNISYSAEDISFTGYVDQGIAIGGNSSPSRRKNTMLENDSWSHAPNGISSSPDDKSIKEESSLACENTTPSVHAFDNNNANSTGIELCGNDAILGDKICSAPHLKVGAGCYKITDADNSSSDPLGGINHTDDNLDFLENTEEKNSSDFLYYVWSDIENFEDVDRMFRNCDSTFGLGTSKGDDLDWFSSAENMGGSGDVMDPEFEFSCPESNPLENTAPAHDSSKSYSFNDPAMTSIAPIRLKESSWMSEKSDSYMSFLDGPAIANDNEGLIPKAQISGHQKQAKLQNPTEGKRNEHDFVDGCVSNINKLRNEVFSHQAFPAVHMQQQQQALGSGTHNYLQNHLPYMHSDKSPLSGLTSVNPTSSAVKPENNDLTSPSQRDSSRASNQLPLMDGCRGKGEKLHNRQGDQSSVDSSLKHTNTMVHAAVDNLGSVTNEAQYPGAKSENNRDIKGGSLFIPVELRSSNAQESSTMSSGINDVSLEAASLRQLQLVMEQLDLRTKMCIKDSLYRLARSAEQRHSHAISNGSCGNGRDASGAFMAGEENNFMDIETDTNPIDRSVAHLLFHRPSESASVPAHDTLQFKSPNQYIRGSVTSQPLMVENLNNSEETTSGTGASDR